MSIEWSWPEPKVTSVQLSVLSLLLILLIHYFPTSPTRCEEELQTANRTFSLEPRVLALIRWSYKARKILDSAYRKLNGRVYKVARGDLDLVVVPSEFIPELNLLPDCMISSKGAHAYNLTGRFNGMNIVTKTDIHAKAVQHKLTPSLPRLLEPMKIRIGKAIEEIFPTEFEIWATIKPMAKILHCISMTTSLIAVGAPLCDNPEYIRLTSEHAKHVFTVTMILRLIPKFLRPLIVWFLPAKWRLERSFRNMASFVVPEAKMRQELVDPPKASDLLSWMMEKARNPQENDPNFLTLLQAVIAAGATHTTAILIFNTLFDLATHPHFLDVIREEISAQHEENQGTWDQKAFDCLYKLDSAMKETVRLNPASLTVYSRMMLDNHTLSNGVTLKKGSMICVSSCSKQFDHSVFPDPETYDALRAYNLNLDAHRAQPFKSIDDDGLRWGTGRWACPGRFLASLEAKVILVKILDEYDFKLQDGQKRPSSITIHEFIFANEHARLQMRRRKKRSGLPY